LVKLRHNNSSVHLTSAAVLASQIPGPFKGFKSEINACELWLRAELKKRSSHLLNNLSLLISAPPSRKSWVRIPLNTPENFRVHKWDNLWDCAASVRIIKSVYVQTQIFEKTCCFSRTFLLPNMSRIVLNETHVYFNKSDELSPDPSLLATNTAWTLIVKETKIGILII